MIHDTEAVGVSSGVLKKKKILIAKKVKIGKKKIVFNNVIDDTL